MGVIREVCRQLHRFWDYHFGHTLEATVLDGSLCKSSEQLSRSVAAIWSDHWIPQTGRRGLDSVPA